MLPTGGFSPPLVPPRSHVTVQIKSKEPAMLDFSLDFLYSAYYRFLFMGVYGLVSTCERVSHFIAIAAVSDCKYFLQNTPR